MNATTKPIQIRPARRSPAYWHVTIDNPPIANTKRLVNASLPPDIELGAGWDACMASLGRPAAQENIKTLIARGFHKPGDVEDRLGYHLGQLTR